MKRFFYLIVATLLSASSIKAQTTAGQEFWVTFGSIRNTVNPFVSLFNMQIRIATGHLPASGTIYFTNLDESEPFDINAYEVYTYFLNNDQKQAVYNLTTGITDYSIHVSSSEPVSVYAFIGVGGCYDATNVLPVKALGTEYYHCSYTDTNDAPFHYMDAYAVVATQDNTHLYHKGIWEATLNAGQVYYRTFTDMTGSLITADNPVAFFALHRGARIPENSESGGVSSLIQQLAPVKTWDKTFCVPVTLMEQGIVRIVVSQNNTDITTLIGGSIRTDVPGAQTTLTNLQAGDFVELDIFSNGCYIEAEQPVGVCSYIRNLTLPPNFCSNAAQAWIPGIKQTISNALIAPLNAMELTPLTHQALILTPTATRTNTKVSIGGMSPTDVSGGTWIENTAGEMSFYSMPLTNNTASYHFSNQQGIIVFGYGVGIGPFASYYYLAYSAMRELDAAFYANDIHFQDLEENPFCENEVLFRAEIEGLHPDPESLKWFIDGVEETSAQDQLQWSKAFSSAGEYEITMWVRYETNETVSKTGILKIESCGTSAGFYANDVYYENLPNTTICTKDVVNFRAEIEGINPNPGSLKWYIDGVEEVSAQDQLQWSKELPTGTYNIKMWVLFENNQDITIESTLKVELFWVKIRNIQH